MLEDANIPLSLHCDTASHSLVFTLMVISAREHLPSPRHRCPGLLFPARTHTAFLSSRTSALCRRLAPRTRPSRPLDAMEVDLEPEKPALKPKPKAAVYPSLLMLSLYFTGASTPFDSKTEFYTDDGSDARRPWTKHDGGGRCTATTHDARSRQTSHDNGSRRTRTMMDAAQQQRMVHDDSGQHTMTTHNA